MPENKKQRHICFLSTYAYPLFNQGATVTHGGAEIQMSLLAKGLKKTTNYLITVVVGDFKQGAEEIYDGIRVVKSVTPRSDEGFFTLLRGGWQYLRTLFRLSPDVMITTGAGATIALVGFYARFWHKYHIHRTAHIEEVDGSYVETKGMLGKLFRWGLLNADEIITQNQSHQNELKEQFNKTSIVFRNVFPVKAYSEADKKHILWVGRRQDFKRPQLFLELAKAFPQELFVMICPKNNPDDKSWDKLQQSVRDISNLRFIEKVPFEHIQIYFNQAKVFVNTSVSEGFPNTFIQAGIGRAALLSLKVDPDNFITVYDCGYVCQDDSAMLVENLKKLLHNPMDWQERGLNTYQYVLENHSLNSGIAKFGKIIHNALK